MLNLSVVIPTLNRSRLLKKALNSITKQTLPQSEFEVMVVNNGSTDETEKVVKSFFPRIKNLRYFYTDKPGLHIGRHLGLKKSKSQILVYADDDIEAFSGWLAAIKDSFKNKNVFLVGGKNLPKFETKPPSWLEKIWLSKGKYGKAFGYLSISDFGNKIMEIDPFYVWGCNFSIRKSVLLESEGFHPDGMPPDLVKYRGDGESYISKYILSKGYKTIYNPNASIYHLISKEKMTIDYLCKRAYMEGISTSYSKVRYNDKCLIDDQSSYGKVKNDNTWFLERIGIIKNYVKKVPNKIKVFLLEKKMRKDKNQIILEKLERCFQKGFNFHQKEVIKDRDLLKWVTKNNYLN